MLTLELPFPPSLNHYYRHLGHVTLISRRGRAYREAVVALLAAQGIKPLGGPLDVAVELFPPDRRKRDADNFHKCLSDALQHAGVFQDDSQVVRLEIWKRDPVKGGKVVVRLRELNGDGRLEDLKNARRYLSRVIEQIEGDTGAAPTLPA
ncbi:MAG TPA: RusA family crossover junction endodeoxyribonuclease [Gemmataceae bacterium]|jgi:crossover junction endodeoxyribonuclease RusA|nr:RusA family crossover junction endodeoxyribonuclease [Gemmataceae bacterium]